MLLDTISWVLWVDATPNWYPNSDPWSPISGYHATRLVANSSQKMRSSTSTQPLRFQPPALHDDMT